MKSSIIIALLGILVVTLLYFTYIPLYFASFIARLSREKSREPAVVTTPLHYTFNVSGMLEETGKPSESTSPYWWLNSGAHLYAENNIGKTVQGELNPLSRWRLLYARNNPVDTDQGKHPQNIFRLVTRSKFENFRQEIFVRIGRYNLSKSPNRNASNGIFLWSRYLDGQNVYYAGIRVDGMAVLKKKTHGEYTTLAIKRFWLDTYERDDNPNLLPQNTWLGIRTETVNDTRKGVTIRLFLNIGDEWVKVLEAYDDGQKFGGPALTQSGYAGIRSDFMDLEMRDYKISSL